MTVPQGMPANSWTIAYRKPRANKFHRATNWSGTWEQARVMAGRFAELQDDAVQVYYVTTAEYEAWELAEDRARIARGEITAEYAASRYEDHGNVMVDSGKRIRMTDTGTLPARLMADCPPPPPVLPEDEPAGWNITSGETVTVDGLPGEWVLETEDEQPTNETTSVVAVYPKDPEHPHFLRSAEASVDQVHRVVWAPGTKVSDYDGGVGVIVADPTPDLPDASWVAVLWVGSSVPSVVPQTEVHRIS